MQVCKCLPGLGFAIGAHPKFNWGFATEPVAGMENRNLVFLQGKLIGGSSSINGMIYTRGHAAEYDQWRQMGCAGWSGADVLPYFKRSERNARGAGPWHGDDGPMHVRPARPGLAICDAFLEAAGASGYPVLDDLNCDPVEGFGYYDINVGRGRRMSTAEAFLTPAAGRANLSSSGVRKALEEALAGIKPTDAMIVGMFQQFGNQVAMNANHVRELCVG